MPEFEIPRVSGMMPEETVDLHNPDGSVRIRIVSQMWKQEGRTTVATTSIFGPIEMSDADADWIADRIKMLFRKMDLYQPK